MTWSMPKSPITIGDNVIESSDCVRNLGAYFTMVERWLHTRHTNGMSCWRYFVLCMSVNLQHYIVLLEVYQHVVVGLPTTTCCYWFTNMLLLVYQQQHVVVGLPTCCCWFTNNNMLLLVYQQQHVVVGLPTCCCWFTNNNMLLLVYQHVVVGLPTTTCCWFTNMLLLVYQQQHVVVGLPTCCCRFTNNNMLLLVYQHVVVGIYYNLHLQHLHIKESPETLKVFPFLDAWFSQA